MAAEELLTELKGGQSSFSLMGKAVVKDNALEGVQQKEGKTWRHVNSSFGVDTGDGNTIYARIWGGYKTDNPVLHKRSAEDNKYFQIPWGERLNEERIDSVSPFDIFRAGFERGEDGRLIVKEFLSEIDFEEYLREHLADGMPVRVNGDVEYSEYNDDINRRYNIRSVFLAEPYKNKDGETISPEPLSQIRQTYLLDEHSLERGWEKELSKEGKTIVGAFVPQYLSQLQKGKKYIEFKKTVPLAQAIVIKMKDATDEKELESKKKIINMFFKVKRDTVREIVLINNINEGYDEATGVEINDEMRELIEMGVFTEEDIKKQVTIRGNRISELVFSQPAVTKDKDSGDVKLQLNDNKYSPEALIVPIIDGEEDEPEDVEGSVTVSDDDFAELFG